MGHSGDSAYGIVSVGKEYALIQIKNDLDPIVYVLSEVVDY